MGALLLDLSSALEDYDLSEQVRKRLRACFWVLVDEGQGSQQ